MLAIGQNNELEILRDTKVGLFLGDGQEEVLLPNKYVPENFAIGDKINVFVYLDHEHRPVATTLDPYVRLNKFAFLRVSHVNQFGAFLDWGLEKDLFVPFNEQARPMETSKRYLIYLYLDEKSKRLVASSKTNGFLKNDELDVQPGEEVDLIISHITDAGINVIINEKYKGLVFASEVFDERIRTGDRMTGYIKNIRPDHKIDVTFQKPGYEGIEPNADKILSKLKAGRGHIRLTDSSDPEDIKALLQMSKKTFKKAIGALYKEKLITIREDGIYLV